MPAEILKIKSLPILPLDQQKIVDACSFIKPIQGLGRGVLSNRRLRQRACLRLLTSNPPGLGFFSAIIRGILILCYKVKLLRRSLNFKAKSLTLRVILTAILLSLILSFSSCSRTQSSRFYRLSPLSQRTESSATPEQNLNLGIGPVTIPEYLASTQILIKDGENKVIPTQYEKWAEPLKSGISRVIAENLSNALITNSISEYPWKSDAGILYQVAVDVISFEGAPGQDTNLEARWKILSSKGNLLIIKRRTYNEKSSGGDVNSLVTSQNKLLLKMSDEIAAEIKTLLKQ